MSTSLFNSDPALAYAMAVLDPAANRRRWNSNQGLLGFGDQTLMNWPLASGFQAGIEAPQILVNVVDTKDGYQIRAEIAGVDKKDCKIRIDNGVLTISGEKSNENVVGDPKSEYYRKESSFGSFSRSLTLPPDARVDEASAKMANGVLTIEFKKLPAEALAGKTLTIE